MSEFKAFCETLVDIHREQGNDGDDDMFLEFIGTYVEPYCSMNNIDIPDKLTSYVADLLNRNQEEEQQEEDGEDQYEEEESDQEEQLSSTDSGSDSD